jgi:phage-related protein
MLTGPEVVLLHAYKKQRQKAPLKELETAERRMDEVVARRR